MTALTLLLALYLGSPSPAAPDPGRALAREGRRLAPRAPDPRARPAAEPPREVVPVTCPICKGSGWVAWANTYEGRKPSQIAIPTTGPPNLNARPCPRCRPREAEERRRR